ncbi:hypothetical protein FQN50_007679 [Emmonsiellopsis sp. PD_5]|nr:hypothetical protein FQN50_007679 [Emmonsiellopsis sp. PD_5]
MPAVTDQAATLLTTLQQVFQELYEVRRLRALVHPLLRPDEIEWINRIIAETETIANDMAILLEPCRVAQETTGKQKIGLGNRLRWLMRDSHKAREKAARLQFCRHALMVVMGNLHTRASMLGNPGGTFILPPAIPAFPFPFPTTFTRAVELDSAPALAAETAESGNRFSLSTFELKDMLAWRRSKGKCSTAAPAGEPKTKAKTKKGDISPTTTVSPPITALPSLGPGTGSSPTLSIPIPTIEIDEF